MYNIIERYMDKLTKSDIDNFAKQKGANLSPAEIDFTYTFIKKNWQDIIKNPSIFNINRYESKYSPTNFIKVKQVFNEYLQKFSRFL